MKLNCYKNTKTPTVISGTSIYEWFSKIEASSFSDKIQQARAGELDYNQVKLLEVPCVTYNFIFDKYKKDENIITSTGLMYIDIDDPSFSISTLDKNKIVAVYHSFGGFGWSIIVRVDGLTKENFKFNYTRIAAKLGIEEYIDKNAIKASQFNVMSFDPNIFINENPTVFVAEQTEQVELKTVPTSIVYRKKEERAYTTDVGTVFTKLRFDDLDKVEVTGDYIVNWEGIEWVKCWIPIHKQDKNRNALLLSYCNNLVWLNAHITKDRALKVLKSVNEIAFRSPVSQDQLCKVIDSIFKYKEDGTLKPIYFKKKRKIVFNKNTGLTKEDKLDICRQELTKKHIDTSKNRLYQILEKWDLINGKASIRNVANNSNMNVKTVAKYWPEFKEYIEQINKK